MLRISLATLVAFVLGGLLFQAPLKWRPTYAQRPSLVTRAQSPPIVITPIRSNATTVAWNILRRSPNIAASPCGTVHRGPLGFTAARSPPSLGRHRARFKSYKRGTHGAEIRIG